MSPEVPILALFEACVEGASSANAIQRQLCSYSDGLCCSDGKALFAAGGFLHALDDAADILASCRHRVPILFTQQHIAMVSRNPSGNSFRLCALSMMR